MLDYYVYNSPLKLFASSSLDANESLRTHEKKKGLCFIYYMNTRRVLPDHVN